MLMKEEVYLAITSRNFTKEEIEFALPEEFAAAEGKALISNYGREKWENGCLRPYEALVLYYR